MASVASRRSASSLTEDLGITQPMARAYTATTSPRIKPKVPPVAIARARSSKESSVRAPETAYTGSVGSATGSVGNGSSGGKVGNGLTAGGFSVGTMTGGSVGNLIGGSVGNLTGGAVGATDVDIGVGDCNGSGVDVALGDGLDEGLGEPEGLAAGLTVGAELGGW